MKCKGAAWVTTTYPDGTVVAAHPNHRPEDVALAVELGYGGDVQALTLWHDPIHTRLCHALGIGHSPTLWALAHRQLAPPCAALEEAMVLAAQRFLNAWETWVHECQEFGCHEP